IYTSQAVQKKVGSLIKKTEIPSESIKVKSSLPIKYSSVDKGYITSVKTQGSHSTCWAFAAMSVMETALLKNGFGTYDLSEEHLDSWATERSDGTGWIRSLNDGAFSDAAMGYLASWQGARLDSDIPFGYATGKTFEQVDKLGTTEYGATDIIKLPNDIATIKTAIMDYGSVSANFSANSFFFNQDNTAAYAYKTFSSSSQIEGHAITIVGWDDNYSKTNFKTGYQPTKDGAWLCKNSWGDYNSLNGYFWISYEDKYLFNDILSTPFTIKDFIQIDENTKLYQVEEYGATYDFNLTFDNNGVTEDVENITYINKFDFTERYSNLESVVFETISVGAEYTIYFIPLNKSDEPISDENKWTELSTGVVDYSGYISADTDYTLPYSKGAIGIKIDGTKNGIQSTLGCDEWLSDYDGNYMFIPDTVKDVSYIKLDGDILELSNFYNTYFSDDIGSNFVIKAITTADEGVKKYDVNNDGKISLIDAVVIQRYLIDTYKLDRNQTFSADIDENGIVNLADAVRIQKALL
ncbi:MAG: C1 family peptidase, partial [Acutalibacteraceae bacterium]|nr:C1 family peptidase [Acutalibacteraceae bacterium]